MNPLLRITIPALCLLAFQAVSAQTPALAAKISSQGLQSLSYNGAEFLLPSARGGASAAVYYADGKRIPLNSQSQGSTRNYSGLAITTSFNQTGNVLNLIVTYKNSGSQEISKIEDSPFSLHFPRRPLGGSWKWGYSTMVETGGSPGICVANWGTDKLLLCVTAGSADPNAEDTDRPMSIGFSGASGVGAASSSPVSFVTTFAPALAPGKQWTYHASLRFAPSATPNRQVAGEIYDAFLKLYPFTLDWPDRRPVGMLCIAQSAQNWPTNMRGYFNDPKVDVTTSEGRASFHDRLMKWADSCVAELKSVGAQGMVLWDVEGDQMPHAITYLGDPRVLPQEAPEMDACADEMFKKFLDAGIKTGICIRPSKVIPDGKGGWKHQQVDDHVAEMADKIAYAKKRWGCTLFYMDTNVKWPMHDLSKDMTRGMWQGNATLISAKDMVELAHRSPGALICPEFGYVAYHSTGGEYTEGLGTSDAIRDVYPHALSLVCLKDSDILGQWDIRLKNAMAGDLELFRGWFGDTPNTYVKALYQEVDYLKRASTVPPTDKLDAALANTDPLVRFVAVHRLDKPDAAQTALLLAALPKEPEWIVQREIIVALGKSDDPQVEPALAAILQDPRSTLGNVVAPLLGRYHTATPVLLAQAENADWRFAGRALEALALSDDPSATAPLLKLTDNSNPRIRAAVVHALATRPSPEVTAKLLQLLVSEQDANTLAQVCAALGASKDPSAKKPLLDFLLRTVSELKNNTLREAATDALESITGLQIGINENAWKSAIKD